MDSRVAMGDRTATAVSAETTDRLHCDRKVAVRNFEHAQAPQIFHRPCEVALGLAQMLDAILTRRYLDYN